MSIEPERLYRSRTFFPNTPAVNSTACRIKRVHYSHLRAARCQLCGRSAPRAWEVSRTAIDVDLDGPVFLLVTVGVHHCRRCERHFRAQPPFLRPNALYTERVRQKATLSVYEDGMAGRKAGKQETGPGLLGLPERGDGPPLVPRVRRECGLRRGLPAVGSRGVLRGSLCVDEVYQDRLALLLALDPAVPGGDRLVG